MKTLVTFLITLSIFGCKQNIEEPVIITPGLAGTYSNSSVTNISEVFKILLPGYNNFKESVTVIIVQTGAGNYNMKVQMEGSANQAGNTALFRYGFNADLNSIKPVDHLETDPLLLKGVYSNLIPESSDLDPGKQITAQIKAGYQSIEIILSTPFKEDAGFLINTKLPKTK